MIAASILLLAAVISVFLLIQKTKVGSPPKVLLYLHFTFLVLASIDFILCLKTEWSFRGAYTDRFIFIIWVSSGILLFGYYAYKKAHHILRIYFGIYFSVLLLVLMGLFIPISRKGVLLVGLGLLEKGVERYQAAEGIQLQQGLELWNTGYPMLDVVESEFIFEKTSKKVINRPFGTIKSMRATPLENNRLHVFIITEDTSKSYTDTIINLGR